MTKYKITRAEFFTDKKGKRWVIYFSVVEGNCYASVHDITGLTDEQAKGVFDKKDGYLHGKFRREHFRQVTDQYQANQRKTKIILN
jgi:hypothetical protein